MIADAKKKFQKYLNLGTIIFLVIVIYLSVCVVRYLGKEKLAAYEVSKSEITESISGTGIIVRHETLVNTEQDGYVNYYLKDGSRVKKNGTVYIVDASGKLQSGLSQLLAEKDQVSSEEKDQIFEDLKVISEGFADDDFSDIYDAKNTINHDLMSYSDMVIADNKEELEAQYGKNCYVEVASDKAGLVSFSSDGLEGLKAKEVDQSYFNKRKKMTDLRSSEKMTAGSPVYRIVTEQSWKLVISVSEDDYKRMKALKKSGTENVKVTFRKDNFTVSAPFKCSKKDDGYYITLSFENYVQRYLNQRYLSVELILSETEGLKIPTSSLVSKDTFKIPTRLLTAGSNSTTKNQVNVLTTNKKGEKVLHQKTVTIYRTEDDMSYVYSSELSIGDIIADLDKTDRFKLEEVSQLQGVFLINRGYAIFEPIVISERNEDYCLIEEDQSSIKLYDRVILNSNTIKENDIIY